MRTRRVFIREVGGREWVGLWVGEWVSGEDRGWITRNERMLNREFLFSLLEWSRIELS